MAYALQYAPLSFIEDLARSSRQVKRPMCTWASIDMDGDTPCDLAKRRKDDSDAALAIVNEQLEQEDLEYFYQSAAEFCYCRNDFRSCLEYLDCLEESDWRKCTRARALSRLESYGEALNWISEMKESGAILRLRSSIMLENGDYILTFVMNRLAFAKEARTVERIAIQ